MDTHIFALRHSEASNYNPFLQKSAHAAAQGHLCAMKKIAKNNIANLTPRQRQVMRLVLAGLPSKNIAATLGISRRTVENHRASIMKRTGSKSIPALACLAFTASWDEPEGIFHEYGFQQQLRRKA